MRISFSCTALVWLLLVHPQARAAISLAAIPAQQAQSSPVSSEHAVALSVPIGTPLQIALDREVRIRKVGEPVQGRLMQTVYAYDHLVLSPGTRVEGHIASIARPGAKRLTWSILSADFTPARAVEVSFDAILLPDGRRLPLHVSVVPGSGQVIKLIDSGSASKNAPRHGVGAKMDEAKQQWSQAMQQIRQPGKFHRALRIGEAQLPVHPQYLDAGTLYYAELEQPLEFGSEEVHEQSLASLGTPPPGSLVRASLVTPLDFGTTQHGAPVEAVVSKPLFAGDRLILPQGALLKGSVLQVRPARRLKHNGELRIAFHELVLSEGPTLRVDTTLEGIEAGASSSPSLDGEGGVKATNPKSRYVTTGISVSLALIGAGAGTMWAKVDRWPEARQPCGSWVLWWAWQCARTRWVS